MPYKHTNSKGKEYYLHARSTPTASGTRTLYYFSGTSGEGAVDHVPEGYEVSETANGMPVLKRKAAAGGEAGSTAKGETGRASSGSTKRGSKS